MSIKPALLFIFSFSLLLLISCGGGIGEKDPGPARTNSSEVPTTPKEQTDTPGTVFGTAASGSPIAGTVSVRGAGGNVFSTGIAPNGNFSVDSTGLIPPFLLKAEGTVQGKSITEYSVTLTPGRVNITPLTTLVLAKIIGADPFENSTDLDTWYPKISDSSVSAAEAWARVQIEPLLSATGVLKESVNVLSTEFEANHELFDRVLDSLEITLQGENATIKNILTGSIISNDLKGEFPATVFDEQEEYRTRDEIEKGPEIQGVIDEVEKVWLGDPSTSPAPEVSFDFLSDGMTRNDFLSAWADGRNLLKAVGTLSIATLRPMKESEYDFKKYEKGVWIHITITENGVVENKKNSMVFDGTRWLLHGNRQWVDARMYGNALLEVDASESRFSTGISIRLEDRYNYAHNQGVTSAIITGPGLPENGVVFVRDFPNGNFIPSGVVPTTDGRLYRYNLDNDNTIEGISENSIFSVHLYDNSPNAVSLADTSVHRFTKVLSGRPVLNSSLRSSVFLSLEAPESHTLSSIDTSKPFTAKWTPPKASIGLKSSWTPLPGSVFQSPVYSSPLNVKSARITLFDLSYQPYTYEASQIDNQNRELSIDISGFQGKTIKYGELWLDAYGKFGRGFITRWIFSDTRVLSGGHLTTSRTCEDCHKGTGLGNGAAIDHISLTGTCLACHSKPANHISVTNTCEDCHRLQNWQDVSIDHSSVLGVCSGCHSKTSAHISTNEPCETCHSPVGW